jgi:DNA-binding transcriptional ArsR family regulator
MSAKRLNPRASLKQTAAIFAALGDTTRLGLVATLCSGPPQSISALAHDSKLTRQGLTRHLQTLERAGLLRRTRAGRESICEFRPQPLKEIEVYLKDVSDERDGALARLKAFVEE